MMFIILLAACGEGNIPVDGGNTGHNAGHNTDGNVGGDETISAYIPSERTYAEIDGNTVNHWSEPTESVSVTITGTEPTYAVETVFTGDIAVNSSATIDQYDGAHFVSETVPVESIDEDSPLRDCVDLAGEWVMKYDGFDTEYPFTVSESSCSPTIPEMDDVITVDGFYFTSNDWNGVISDDGNTIQLIVKNDSSIHATATRQ